MADIEKDVTINVKAIGDIAEIKKIFEGVSEGVALNVTLPKGQKIDVTPNVDSTKWTDAFDKLKPFDIKVLPKILEDDWQRKFDSLKPFSVRVAPVLETINSNEIADSIDKQIEDSISKFPSLFSKYILKSSDAFKKLDELVNNTLSNRNFKDFGASLFSIFKDIGDNVFKKGKLKANFDVEFYNANTALDELLKRFSKEVPTIPPIGTPMRPDFTGFVEEYTKQKSKLVLPSINVPIVIPNLDSTITSLTNLKTTIESIPKTISIKNEVGEVSGSVSIDGASIDPLFDKVNKLKEDVKNITIGIDSKHFTSELDNLVSVIDKFKDSVKSIKFTADVSDVKKAIEGLFKFKKSNAVQIAGDGEKQSVGKEIRSAVSENVNTGLYKIFKKGMEYDPRFTYGFEGPNSVEDFKDYSIKQQKWKAIHKDDKTWWQPGIRRYSDEEEEKIRNIRKAFGRGIGHDEFIELYNSLSDEVKSDWARTLKHRVYSKASNGKFSKRDYTLESVSPEQYFKEIVSYLHEFDSDDEMRSKTGIVPVIPGSIFRDWGKVDPLKYLGITENPSKYAYIFKEIVKLSSYDSHVPEKIYDSVLETINKSNYSEEEKDVLSNIVTSHTHIKNGDGTINYRAPNYMDLFDSHGNYNPDASVTISQNPWRGINRGYFDFVNSRLPADLLSEFTNEKLTKYLSSYFENIGFARTLNSIYGTHDKYGLIPDMPDEIFDSSVLFRILREIYTRHKSGTFDKNIPAVIQDMVDGFMSGEYTPSSAWFDEFTERKAHGTLHQPVGKNKNSTSLDVNSYQRDTNSIIESFRLADNLRTNAIRGDANWGLGILEDSKLEKTLNKLKDEYLSKFVELIEGPLKDIELSNKASELSLEYGGKLYDIINKSKESDWKSPLAKSDFVSAIYSGGPESPMVRMLNATNVPFDEDVVKKKYSAAVQEIKNVIEEPEAHEVLDTPEVSEEPDYGNILDGIEIPVKLKMPELDTLMEKLKELKSIDISVNVVGDAIDKINGLFDSHKPFARNKFESTYWSPRFKYQSYFEDSMRALRYMKTDSKSSESIREITRGLVEKINEIVYNSEDSEFIKSGNLNAEIDRAREELSKITRRTNNKDWLEGGNRKYLDGAILGDDLTQESKKIGLPFESSPGKPSARFIDNFEDRYTDYLSNPTLEIDIDIPNYDDAINKINKLTKIEKTKFDSESYENDIGWAREQYALADEFRIQAQEKYLPEDGEISKKLDRLKKTYDKKLMGVAGGLLEGYELNERIGEIISEYREKVLDLLLNAPNYDKWKDYGDKEKYREDVEMGDLGLVNIHNSEMPFESGGKPFGSVLNKYTKDASDNVIEYYVKISNLSEVIDELKELTRDREIKFDFTGLDKLNDLVDARELTEFIDEFLVAKNDIEKQGINIDVNINTEKFTEFVDEYMLTLYDISNNGIDINVSIGDGLSKFIDDYANLFLDAQKNKIPISVDDSSLSKLYADYNGKKISIPVGLNGIYLARDELDKLFKDYGSKVISWSGQANIKPILTQNDWKNAIKSTYPVKVKPTMTIDAWKQSIKTTYPISVVADKLTVKNPNTVVNITPAVSSIHDFWSAIKTYFADNEIPVKLNLGSVKVEATTGKKKKSAGAGGGDEEDLTAGMINRLNELTEKFNSIIGDADEGTIHQSSITALESLIEKAKKTIEDYIYSEDPVSINIFDKLIDEAEMNISGIVKRLGKWGVDTPNEYEDAEKRLGLISASNPFKSVLSDIVDEWKKVATADNIDTYKIEEFKNLFTFNMAKALAKEFKLTEYSDEYIKMVAESIEKKIDLMDDGDYQNTMVNFLNSLKKSNDVKYIDSIEKLANRTFDSYLNATNKVTTPETTSDIYAEIQDIRNELSKVPNATNTSNWKSLEGIYSIAGGTMDITQIKALLSLARKYMMAIYKEMVEPQPKKPTIDTHELRVREISTILSAIGIPTSDIISNSLAQIASAKANPNLSDSEREEVGKKMAIAAEKEFNKLTAKLVTPELSKSDYVSKIIELLRSLVAYGKGGTEVYNNISTLFSRANKVTSAGEAKMLFDEASKLYREDLVGISSIKSPDEYRTELQSYYSRGVARHIDAKSLESLDNLVANMQTENDPEILKMAVDQARRIFATWVKVENTAKDDRITYAGKIQDILDEMKTLGLETTTQYANISSQLSYLNANPNVTDKMAGDFYKNAVSAERQAIKNASLPTATKYNVKTDSEHRLLEDIGKRFGETSKLYKAMEGLLNQVETRDRKDIQQYRDFMKLYNLNTKSVRDEPSFGAKVGAGAVKMAMGAVQKGITTIVNMYTGILNKVKGILTNIIKKTITLAIDPFKKSVKKFVSIIKQAAGKSKALSSLSELFLMPIVLAVEFTLLPVLKKMIPAIKEVINWVVASKNKFALMGEYIAVVVNKVYTMLSGNFVNGFERFFDELKAYENWINTEYAKSGDTFFGELQRAGVGISDISNNLVTLGEVTNTVNTALVDFAKDTNNGGIIMKFLTEVEMAIGRSINTSTESIATAIHSVLNDEELSAELSTLIQNTLSHLFSNIETTTKIAADFFERLTTEISAYLENPDNNSQFEKISDNIVSIVESVMDIAVEKVIPKLLDTGVLQRVVTATAPIWIQTLLLSIFTSITGSMLSGLGKLIGNKILKSSKIKAILNGIGGTGGILSRAKSFLSGLFTKAGTKLSSIIPSAITTVIGGSKVTGFASKLLTALGPIATIATAGIYTFDFGSRLSSIQSAIENIEPTDTSGIQSLLDEMVTYQGGKDAASIISYILSGKAAGDTLIGSTVDAMLSDIKTYLGYDSNEEIAAKISSIMREKDIGFSEALQTLVNEAHKIKESIIENQVKNYEALPESEKLKYSAGQTLTVPGQELYGVMDGYHRNEYGFLVKDEEDTYAPTESVATKKDNKYSWYTMETEAANKTLEYLFNEIKKSSGEIIYKDQLGSAILGTDNENYRTIGEYIFDMFSDQLDTYGFIRANEDLSSIATILENADLSDVSWKVSGDTPTELNIIQTINIDKDNKVTTNTSTTGNWVLDSILSRVNLGSIK